MAPEKVCVVSAILPRPPQIKDLMKKIKSDIEIARAANIKPIKEILKNQIFLMILSILVQWDAI